MLASFIRMVQGLVRRQSVSSGSAPRRSNPSQAHPFFERLDERICLSAPPIVIQYPHSPHVHYPFTQMAVHGVTGPEGVATADFNGDGKPDIITANTATRKVTVLLYTGNNKFSAPIITDCGTSAPTRVATGDFNGDGKQDVVVVGRSVVVLYGNGDGTFTYATTLPAGTTPVNVTVGDLNKDGKPDVVVANFYSNDISVFLNKGDGTFNAPVTYACGYHPTSVAIGDLNGDGKADLAVSIFGSRVDGSGAGVDLLYGKGAGAFSTASLIQGFYTGARPMSVAMGDLNGDGRLDLALSLGGWSEIAGIPEYSILLNRTKGTPAKAAFSKAASFSVGLLPESIVFGDFNYDGKMDVATANYGSGTLSLVYGDGAGSFTLESLLDTRTGGPCRLATADFNGDGRLDLVSADFLRNEVTVLMSHPPTT